MKIEFVSKLDTMMLKDFILEMGVSRAFARRVKLYGKMYINDVLSKNYFLVKKGDRVTLEYDEAQNEAINVVKEELDICYEDEHLLVLNKPKNLASQPSRLHQFDNIISFVKAYFIEKGINTNIHLVNRLDYSTSGLLIIAKDGYTHHALSKVEIKRKYLAVVKGHLDKKEDEVRLKIDRVEAHNIKRWVMETGKEAITIYKVLKEYSDSSLVDVELKTGRTHQIRVTFSYLNHPVLGDKLYGEGEDLMLHCYYLKFKDPYSNSYIEVKKAPNWENYIENSDNF